MSVFDTSELKSQINTIIDKSGEVMDTENPTPIKIAPRKSILKTPSTSFNQNDTERDLNEEFLNRSSLTDLIPRPHNLKDFEQKEELTEICDVKSTFNLNELDEDEEIWVIDIPRTIDPKQLKGQTLQLGEKSKFKVGEDRYCAINRDSKSSLTCVFNTGDVSSTYKAVNVKPAGTISMRRKLSGISKKKIEYTKPEGVPFPKNIKVRHPFLGVQVDSSIVKNEKKY